jgi:hypothetical protein
LATKGIICYSDTNNDRFYECDASVDVYNGLDDLVIVLKDNS